MMKVDMDHDDTPEPDQTDRARDGHPAKDQQARGGSKRGHAQARAAPGELPRRRMFRDLRPEEVG